MNQRYALYEERGDLLERKAISEKYLTGWYLQAKLEEINEQIRVIENVTPQAQKTYFDALSAPAIEVAPWDEDLGARFIISGGEVLELDSHLESAYDERNGDIETDMIF